MISSLEELINFHIGLEKAGFTIKKSYFAEIDKHAIADYKYQFPNAEHIGSVVDFSGVELRRKHPTEIIFITDKTWGEDFVVATKMLSESGVIVKRIK